jgi:hypothetical protein
MYVYFKCKYYLMYVAVGRAMLATNLTFHQLKLFMRLTNFLRHHSALGLASSISRPSWWHLDLKYQLQIYRSTVSFILSYLQ